MIIKAIESASFYAAKHLKAENKVRKLFFERYGEDFSDVDCDPLIDACSGQGACYRNLKELDEMVLQYCNLEPIKK